VYYLRLDAPTPVQPRDQLLNRVFTQWREGRVDIGTLAPVERLYCECGEPGPILRDCIAGLPAQADCSLRWLAVRVGVAGPD